MTTPPAQAAPGWYPDPGGSPTRRWWDGTQWTAATRPPNDPAGDAPPGPADVARTASAPPGWRSLRGLAVASAILYGITAVLAVATVAALLSRVRLIDRVFEGNASFAEVTASDERVGITLGFTALLMLATAVVWLVWFAFAAHDAAMLAKVRRGAVWGWFVPIVSFFRPKQVANDIHRAAGDVHPPAVTQLWWAAWLIGTVLSTAAFRMSRQAGVDDDLEMLQMSARLYAVSFALLAIGAVLALRMTLRLTRRLEERAG